MRKFFPPPLQALLAALLIRFIPLGQSFSLPWEFPAIILLVAIFIALAALWQFQRQSANIDPHNLAKTTQIVQQGIYAYSRNPMYLSLALGLTAWWLYCGSWLSIIWLVGFVVLIEHLQIRPEERFLKGRFGKAYQVYCNNVRRWF
ncbi:isoprenylcysteine carboxyl methyltransferase family protein [Haemophilus pittmaniae HK 85]|uniref:Protein-S-isoprenylcysteine methyltransferase n=2 Tax=Haemophilus pittmaniae TaxID=249188 RepID=A0A377IW66_9PAST|nr:isoprenylcysteine carboxylmethyltransferase family protein [Haemophilus pittmaniae]EGV07136.1 isoprenylcysteine carboxyl methyltransferase family protein [Haemophilus pittmaniae HK 85]SNV89678.1 protein-S-isoprenylcysteine methyltransferase [Haemophilus pittmaniae]STO92198.1 protein-S-isoprenylcysteine methyltransferase [Haemophilus pittmaniae]